VQLGDADMKQTILVIDDEANICTSLHERLTREGYNILTASDGRKGLRVYHGHLIDLVITDVLMPELDGLEVVRALRRLGTAIPIIAMSGGANRDLDFLIEAAEFGATRTISKPFRVEELVAMVHDLLDSIPHQAV
jgi:DNA-binding response OmpR family regulator